MLRRNGPSKRVCLVMRRVVYDAALLPVHGLVLDFGVCLVQDALVAAFDREAYEFVILVSVNRRFEVVLPLHCVAEPGCLHQRHRVLRRVLKVEVLDLDLVVIETFVAGQRFVDWEPVRRLDCLVDSAIDFLQREGVD